MAGAGAQAAVKDIAREWLADDRRRPYGVVGRDLGAADIIGRGPAPVLPVAMTSTKTLSFSTSFLAAATESAGVEACSKRSRNLRPLIPPASFSFSTAICILSRPGAPMNAKGPVSCPSAPIKSRFSPASGDGSARLKGPVARCQMFPAVRT